MSSTPRIPRVLFFDPVDWVQEWSYDIERKLLEPLGVEVLVPSDRDERDHHLPDADVVVVSSVDDLTADHIESLQHCVGILCYSAGTDAVDVEAATNAGIPVRNLHAATGDVADHAMALLLAAWRMLPHMMAEAEAGRWALELHPEYRDIPRLEGSTLGIFGAGHIGRAVASRGRAFGMKTVATYRRPDQATETLPHLPLEELLPTTDAIVLAAALNDSTKGAINESTLALAKRGLVLVNVGRGGLIVETDLHHALESGIVRAAALDVRDPEPPDPATDQLTSHPNVIGTPHTGGVSSEAFISIHKHAAAEIEELLRNGESI